jgi:hypothetical protein
VAKVPFDKGYYAEFKVKEFSEFWLNSGGLNRATPLPVRVLNFTAAKRNSGEVALEWKAENEQNIVRYEIEMADGNAALQANRYAKVGTVAANAGGAPVQSYSFIHTALQSGNEARYYRLRIIEVDGSTRYSEVRSIVFTDAVTWKIYPNPSDGIYNLLFQVASEEDMEAIVYDSKGVLVQRFTQKGTGFLQKATINLRDAAFATGTYLLQVTAGSRKTSFKLYKQ